MEGVVQDLRLALRAFVKNPGFTAVVVLTLALGVGANTAIFSLLDQVMMRALPVAHPERLVVIDAPGPFSGSSHSHSDTLTPMSHPMFERLRDGNAVFSGMLAHYTAPLNLSVGRDTEQVNGDLVSGGFFDVLGLQASAGRLFTPDDDRVKGGHPVVVLGHGFWLRRFAGAPGIVGQSVRVNDQAMTVVGVAPAGFHGVEVGQSVDLYVPLTMQPQVIPTWSRGVGDWRAAWLVVMGRLRDGVSPDQARAGIDVLYGPLLHEDLAAIDTKSETFRARFLEKKLVLLPGGRGTSGLRDQSKTPLVVLMAMVGLVLLIACANVANLLLARASARQKEIAVRLALGASRARLVRQLLAESLVFAAAAGVLGIAFAAWTGTLLLRALPSEQASRVLSADPDLRVGLFAFALSLATGLVFGLVPALQSTRPALAPVLKNEASSIATGGAAFRFRKGLVVAQVALSMLLLVGAGLFTRSLMNLNALDPGFQPERLVEFAVDPALSGYPLARRLAVLKQIQDELRAEPGVRQASMASVALMTDSNLSNSVRVEGYEAKEGEDMNPNFNEVAPGFFETLGISLLRGRDVSEADTAGAPKVAVVNEAFARYFFGTGDPLGRHIGMGGRGEPLDITIVGLVRDGKATSLREAPLRFVYVPYAQQPAIGSMTFYARAAGDPDTLAGRVRRLVQHVDPGLPVTDLKTMRAQIRESLFTERMVASLSAAFGLLATLLAAVGLYGVMSYAVAQRTREIGIRLALGAQRGAVLGLVLGEVAVLVGLGVGIGLPSGYALGRLVEGQLFGLDARDPLTFALATALILVSALLAGYVPAARATRIDPMVALRYQ